MIDTDKYEGHTEGPWRIVEGDSIYDENEYWLAIRSAKGFDVTELSGTTSDIGKSDWNLIADAPLLLAEVKRLHEELNAKIALITDVDEMINESWNFCITQDDWNELVNKHYGDDEE